MSVAHVTSKAEFEQFLSQAGDKLVVVDFHAKWCGPCKQIAPKIEKLAGQMADVVFLKVDVDEVEDVAQEYKISCMPTFIFFKKGQNVLEFSGANLPKLEQHIAELRVAH